MHDISVRNLSFTYPDSTRPVFTNVCLNVKAGEFICLLGQSGCGKSTFLRLLSGLEIPIAGEIMAGNQLICNAGLDRGMVFQDYGLFPWMTAGENIMLALTQRFPQRGKRELKQIALKSLTEVGLDEGVYDELPKKLSGGMKQRCAIAQAFSIDPPILLMDEPFGALDALTRAKLQDLLLELCSKLQKKRTVFFVTHDVDEALLLASRIVVFGLPPSNIIYECSIPSDLHATRETQFDNPKILELRNMLIRQINHDVTTKIP